MTVGDRLRGGLPIVALGAIGGLALAGAHFPLRATDPVARRHIVEIRGMAFHPQALEVRRGDTVVWVNRDIVPHTATATGKSGWDTGTLTQGQSGEHVARRKGTEPYACRLHPTMLGRLIVR